MTVICALKTPRQVIIGSDTEAQDDNFRYSSYGPKWHVGERWAVAFSGHTLLDEVLLAHWNYIFSGDGDAGNPFRLTDAITFSRRMREAYALHGLEPGQRKRENTPVYPTDGGLLTDGRRVWSISDSFDAIEMPDFAAEGSGREYAFGAYYAMRLHASGLSARAMAEAAVRAAIRYCPGCGGEAAVRAFAPAEEEKR